MTTRGEPAETAPALAPAPHPAGRRTVRAAPGAAVAAVVAVLLAAGFLGVYQWAVRTEDGQSADINLLVTLQDLNPTLGPAATALRPGLVLAGALGCTLLGTLALAHRRWRSLSAAVTVVALSVGGTWALKDLVLDRPYLGAYGYTVNTFPSGHVSATLALVAGAALLSPAWRPPATRHLFRLMLVTVAVAACVASLLEHVHRPSDVVGSVLLVGAATALATAVFRPASPGRPRTSQ